MKRKKKVEQPSQQDLDARIVRCDLPNYTYTDVLKDLAKLGDSQDDDSNEPARRHRSAKAIWEEWSCGGAIIPKDHPCSASPFHAIHTLLHVLWDFHMDYNTENVLLDWIDENGMTEEFGAFLEENYHKATDE